MSYKKFLPTKKYKIIKSIRTPAERIKLKRRLVDELGGKCVDCGFNAHLAALDFDHVDPSTKKFGIASKLQNADYLELIEEVKKCVLRCANCHRIKTHPDATD
jgi:hypothetical protein